MSPAAVEICTVGFASFGFGGSGVYGKPCPVYCFCWEPQPGSSATHTASSKTKIGIRSIDVISFPEKPVISDGRRHRGILSAGQLELQAAITLIGGHHLTLGLQ